MTAIVRILGVVACAVAVLNAPAQSWEMSGESSLMLTQNAYSDNWAGEETGSIAWTLNSKTILGRQLHPRVNNKNTLKFSFGQTHSQDPATGSWEKPMKSTDLVDIESVFFFTYGFFVDPFVSARLESQFLDRSDTSKARYVNPLKFTESIGLARAIIKTEKREWTARFGAGFRQYLDRDALTDSLTGDRETRTANDGGFEFVNELSVPLSGDRITLSNKLAVFQALFYSESERLEGLPNQNYWKAPDMNWENILTANITRYVMVNLYTQLLYDKEIDQGARSKQTLSLGATYKIE